MARGMAAVATAVAVAATMLLLLLLAGDGQQAAAQVHTQLQPQQQQQQQHQMLMPIMGNLELMGAARVPATTRLTLQGTGGRFVTHSRAEDGGFTFHDVPAGIYLLDVLSTTHVYSQLKLKVQTLPTPLVTVVEYRYPGAQRQQVPYPITLTALTQQQYFEARKGIGLMSMFQNPMLLMTLGSIALVAVLPKMMKNMDEDQVKDMQEQMKDNDPMAMLNRMMGKKDTTDDDEDED